MRSFAVDAGGPLHVADFGGSGPTLLLVHGLPARASVHMRGLGHRRGAERLVREVLGVCAYDLASTDAAAVDAHVALERERLALPQWHVNLFQTTRSLLRTLMRRRRVEA